jgi:probable addiction module antidote protein
MEAGDQAALLLALRNAVEARTVNSVAHDAGLSRESIYRMLSETGNPCYSSLLGILGALGLQFTIQPASKQSPEEGAAFASEPRLVWEVNDRPREYFSKKFEDFTYAFRNLGTAKGKRNSILGANAGALALTEMAA